MESVYFYVKVRDILSIALLSYLLSLTPTHLSCTSQFFYIIVFVRRLFPNVFIVPGSISEYVSIVKTSFNYFINSPTRSVFPRGCIMIMTIKCK
jgi:hypothetical protein